LKTIARAVTTPRAVALLCAAIGAGGCVAPLRISAGPTLDTHAHIGAEVRVGVGFGPGSSRSAVYEEVFGGGGYRAPSGGFGTFGGGLGAHGLLARRQLGLRGDLHYAARFIGPAPRSGFHGPGASFGLQRPIDDGHRHMLLAGAELQGDLLVPFEPPRTLAGSFFLPLTLELRRDVPGGMPQGERALTAWFKIRETAPNKVVPHVFHAGPAGDEAFTLVGGSWVFVARGHRLSATVAGRVVVLHPDEPGGAAWVFREGREDPVVLGRCGSSSARPRDDAFVCVDHQGSRVEVTAREGLRVLWTRVALLPAHERPLLRGFTKAGDPVFQQSFAGAPWALGASGPIPISNDEIEPAR
jgi:hypothetical protein